jgi:transketolase
MSIQKTMTMRDAFIGTLCERMTTDPSIFFLAADLGAPALDRMRAEFPDRFINVGIAEQNLINVASGLALEGFSVYTYAIAPFITMRAYEQARVNLAISSQIRPVNVTMLGLGGGVSYQVSGPTHHCLEDLAIMRLLPNMTVYCPADWVTAAALVDQTRTSVGPAYIRFDGKALPALQEQIDTDDMRQGFRVLATGTKVCLISTGFMTHRAVAVAAEIGNVGVVDLFALKPFDRERLMKTIAGYDHIISIEEAFIGNGGLDSAIGTLLSDARSHITLDRLGFNDRYVFELGSRDQLHVLSGIDNVAIAERVRRLVNG